MPIVPRRAIIQAEVGALQGRSSYTAPSGTCVGPAASPSPNPPLWKRMASWLLLLLGLGALTAMAACRYMTLPAATSKQAHTVIVSIPQGMTTSDIAELLQEKGIIRDARFLYWLSRLHRVEAKLQAGYYLLSSDMDLREVMHALRDGRVHVERVTIHEGLHLRQIADVLASKGLVDRERFLLLANDESLVYGDQPPIDKPHPSLEGYLFPDTYLFSPAMTEEQIIRTMVNRFMEVVLPVVEGRQAPLGMNLHEVVTLASIVEKEAVLQHEQPIIASVFINRLSVDMPLQADPTIAYLFDEHKPRISYADLQIDSPYNTYRYRGLPPTPIASPGASAIQAVMEPAETEWLFFVARGDGTHIFSRTFREHVQARQQVGR